MGTFYQIVLLFACVSAFADHLETSPRLVALFGRNLGPYPLRQELFRRVARPWVLKLMIFHGSAAALFLAFGDWQRSTGPAFFYLANSFLLFFLIPAGMLWQSHVGSPMLPVFGRRREWYRRMQRAAPMLFRPHPNPLPHGEGTRLLSRVRIWLTGKSTVGGRTDGKGGDSIAKATSDLSLSSGREEGVRGTRTVQASRFPMRSPAQAICLFAVLLAVPVVLTVVLVLAYPPRAGVRVQEILGPAGRSTLSNWLFVLYMLVSAAFAEEFIFRHYLFNRIAALRRGPAGFWAGAVITSLIFCLGHGAMLSPEWLKFVQIMVLGVCLCLCQASLGTAACIGLHLGFNFSVALFVTLAGMG